MVCALIFVMSKTLISWIAYVVYTLAALGSITVKAAELVKNPDTPWDTFKQYAHTKWTKLVTQFFMTNMLFLLFWDNPAAYGVLSLPMIGDTWQIKLGLAIAFGWGSDWVLDKLLYKLGLGRGSGSPPEPPAPGPVPVPPRNP